MPVWQTTDYTYTSKGQLDAIAVESTNADPALPSTTTLTYDDYGLLADTTMTVAGESPRTRHAKYSTTWPGAPDEHLYASELWAEHDNPQCAVDCRPAAWVLTHPAYGLPIATMNTDGVQIVRTYDAHGRPVASQTDGMLPISVTYAGRPDAFGGMNGVQATATSGLQQMFKTFDARGANLRTSFVGFDGQWINTFGTYDGLGRLTAVSRPNAGAPTAWTTYAYDSLGRAVATTLPDSSKITSVYSLLETEHTDPAGHYSYQLYDVDRRLITSGTQLPPAPGCGVCLAQDVKTTYAYSASSVGPIETVLDDQGHATTTHYDRRGRPVQQDDPSTGTTKVAYNGFGEPKQTVHIANGDTETETFDDLGRLLTLTTPDGLTTYTWDVATNGIGHLARAMSPDQIKIEYRYDTLGRSVGIDQTDETNVTAGLDLQYDAQTGRLARIDYPKAPGQSARLRAAYTYNGYGYLAKVSDATTGQPGLVWQQITARNADLALVDAVRGIDAGVGGGAIIDHRDYDPLMGRVWTISARHAGANRLAVSYNYDADGLVNQRITTDETVQIDETFEHDALHRLTHTTRNGLPQNGLPFSVSTDESYDSVGNRIDTLQNGKLIEHRGYGSNGQQPYALTGRDITDPANPNAPPQVQKYQYDALGRLQQDPHRLMKWTAFDLPSSATEDGNTWTFRYDAGQTRAKKSGPDETITYLGGLYEKHASAHGTRHVFHIVGSDEAVAELSYTESAQPSLPGTTTVAYPLVDALGSTDAVADALGTVVEHDYYDSWGQRSNPDGSPLAKPTLFQSLVSAGFTNQEHDDDLALINMHGRLYDPALGRFLSADPIVGNRVFSQSWNAYSYVDNSPLNFIDPSGFDCTAGMAVATGSEKGFIANGECSASSNITLPNGDEARVADASRAPDVGQILSSTIAFIKDQQQMSALEAQTRRDRNASPSANNKSADGTPTLPRRRNGSKLTTNWGWTLWGEKGAHVAGPLHNPKRDPARDSTWLEKKAAAFTVRLFCGSKCAQASAPTSSGEAAHAPKQLSDARIARNAVSQALAARAVVKFLGKVGVVIDEGVDGMLGRLPGGMGIEDDDDKVTQWLADKNAERARLIDEARGQYNEAAKRFTAATSLRDRRLAQANAAAGDLDAIDPSTVGFELIEKVYLDALDDYTNAEGEVGRASRKLQFAHDWLQALQSPDE